MKSKKAPKKKKSQLDELFHVLEAADHLLSNKQLPPSQKTMALGIKQLLIGLLMDRRCMLGIQEELRQKIASAGDRTKMPYKLWRGRYRLIRQIEKEIAICEQLELSNDQAVLPSMGVLPEALKEKYRLPWIKQ